MNYQNSLDFAKTCDQKDVLNRFRDQFYFPTNKAKQKKIYLCGNSLGLQHKSTPSYVNQILDDWSIMVLKVTQMLKIHGCLITNI